MTEWVEIVLPLAKQAKNLVTKLSLYSNVTCVQMFVNQEVAD